VSTAHQLVPLLLALVLGGAVGLEREFHGRPAGLRTHILVCLSSTMLILIARELGGEDTHGATRAVFDPNRMGAGIVTGVGFLGASTVLRSGDFLRGLTTAACIWFVAGLGIVLGTERYLLATVCTCIVILVLTVLNSVAASIQPILYRRLIVLAESGELERLVAEIRVLLTAEGMSVLDIATGRDNERARLEVVFYVSMRTGDQVPRVTEGVARLPGVRLARWKPIAV
jgi:putative Mg2+ transporter-C (MgtC) family protein